jgi:hypothetical protein
MPYFRVSKSVVDGKGGTYTTRQIKTGHPATVFIEASLGEKLKTLPAPGYIFYDARKDWNVFITSAVYRPLRAGTQRLRDLGRASASIPRQLRGELPQSGLTMELQNSSVTSRSRRPRNTMPRS